MACVYGGRQFLSTLSLRRATQRFGQVAADLLDFYPRSPCGERPPRCRRHSRAPKFLSTLSLRRATQTNTGSNESGEFLSTLSLRRATITNHPYPAYYEFLSTLSLRRATRGLSAETPCMSYFYPRSPCGERRYVISVMICTLLFLSTLSLRRAT